MEIEIAGAEEATVDVLVTAALGNLPEDPVERARMRLARLRTTFAASLAIVADMHQDRDWEHLTREDGTPYVSLAEVMVDVFNVSISMARRYVQGARDFYLPLSALTIEGTRIEITSGEVASLGKEGIADAVETARERLDGVEDPDEASRIISESLSEAKERKSPSGAGADGGGGSDGGDFDGYDPGDSPTAKDRGSDRYSGDLMDDLPDDDNSDSSYEPRGDAYGPLTTGLEDDEDSPAPVSGDAAIEKIFAGASTYDTEEAQDALPDPLKEISLALQTLAAMDPVLIGEMIDYDNRGVLLPVDDALRSVKRLRASVEASPWIISRLSQA